MRLLSVVLDPSINTKYHIDIATLITSSAKRNEPNKILYSLRFRGAFARNAVLRVLNVSYNKIKRLDSNSFKGMRFLRRLYLSDNLIADVGRGTFGGLPKVGTIDLARNFIKKIDYQMFDDLKFIEVCKSSEFTQRKWSSSLNLEVAYVFGIGLCTIKVLCIIFLYFPL